MASEKLSEAVSRYGCEAFLLTVSESGPHTTPVSIDLHGRVVRCSIGPSAAKNISRQPNVSLLWPPIEPGGYAMIVNGTAIGAPGLSGVTFAEITLTKSVFHRAGPKSADSNSACASDCKRIALPA